MPIKKSVVILILCFFFFHSCKTLKVEEKYGLKEGWIYHQLNVDELALKKISNPEGCISSTLKPWSLHFEMLALWSGISVAMPFRVMLDWWNLQAIWIWWRKGVSSDAGVEESGQGPMAGPPPAMQQQPLHCAEILLFITKGRQWAVLPPIRTRRRGGDCTGQQHWRQSGQFQPSLEADV